MFSGIFGKKKDKDSAPAGPRSGTSSRTESGKSSAVQGQPTTPPLGSPSGPRTPVPANAREIARATAEKIDKIESEMSLDYTGRSGTSYSRTTSTPPAAAAASPPAGQTGARKRSKRSDGMTSTLPTLGQTTDILLGDSILANAMELSDSASTPAIEEAAILYANGQPLPAIAVLSEAVKAEGQGAHNTQAWMMLLELCQVLGRKAEFENFAIDFALRFESSAPAWVEPAKEEVAPVGAAPASARSTVTFKGVLGSGIVPQLDQLKRLAQKNPVLYLDFSGVTTVDVVGADLILRVFAAFQKSSHEVFIQGAGHIAVCLVAAVEVGRRDSSNAVWMLLLEFYRILGRQSAFEEASIDYCVTYEVSPPPWETFSANFKIADELASESARPVARAAEVELPPDTICLQGDLTGKIEAELSRLVAFAGDRRRIIIDCHKLRRVDFTAAGTLLNWSVGTQAQGRAIEFRDVSNLVSALFAVMGLHEVAQVERRKL